MERQLKFRTFVDGEMVMLEKTGLQYFDFEGSYALAFVVDGYSAFWAHEQYESVSNKVHDSPIMQFTGLTDKNGKKIYEGDVYEAYGEKFQVFFKEGCFVGGKNYDSCMPLGCRFDELGNLADSDMSWMEVVGNIYETPELIKL